MDFPWDNDGPQPKHDPRLETPVWADAAVTSVHPREKQVCHEATILPLSLPRLII